MTHRWLTRAVLAIAVPALLVPTVASSATAAPKPPAVPTIDAVAEIYPHLAGGTAEVNRERKIRMPSTTCKRGAVIKGATGNDAFYGPLVETVDDLQTTGDEPLVGVTSERFPSAKIASQYLRASLTEGKDCPEQAELGADVAMKKIRFHLGTERWGFAVNMGTKKNPVLANVLVVRSGATVMLTMSMSMTGKTAPSIPKTIALAQLALKTAR